LAVFSLRSNCTKIVPLPYKSLIYKVVATIEHGRNTKFSLNFQ
jgi:hypothetical protein